MSAGEVAIVLADYQGLLERSEREEYVDTGEALELLARMAALLRGEPDPTVPAEILGESVLTPGIRQGRVIPRWKGNMAV